MMEPVERDARLSELIKEASAIREHAQQAADAASDGRLQDAVDLIALSQHKVAAYTNCRSAYLQAMENDGVTPGG